MNDIELNFINRSNDANNSAIVIFQKNEVANSGELPVAWKVIENCGLGDHHPFVFPICLYASAADSFGNSTVQQFAYYGDEFKVSMDASGCQMTSVGSQFMVYTDDPVPIPAIGVGNALPKGSISVQIYKDGNLLATTTGIAPTKYATFKFTPTIWIGVVNQVVQGEVMNAAIISQINTEISLDRITKADIIMTGGGPGQSSKPLAFTLVDKSYNKISNENLI